MSSSENVFPDDFFKYDTNNYKRFLSSYAEDLRKSYNRSFRSLIEKFNFKNNIIITGSSWGLNSAKIVNDYLQGTPRILFAEGYSDNLKISKGDLIIVVSYSGASEEAVSWLKIARRVGAKSIILTASDRIVENSSDSAIIDLTKGLPSRCSAFTIIGTLLRLFEDAGLIPSQLDEVQGTVDFLRNQDFSKLADDLSSKLYGAVPLIYGSSSLKNSVFRFKMLINVNAKASAFFGELPGADYFEIEGFSNKNAVFHALLISSSDELSRVRKKVTVFKDVLQSTGVGVTELNIKGKALIKTVSILLIADYVSYYLALRYKVDPLSEDAIKKMKQGMGVFI